MILPDLLEPGLIAVFCGTAPSTWSARAQAYYAKPGNRFWPLLHEVGLTPAQFQPQDYPRLLGLRLGLTDLDKTEIGNDADLSPEALDVAGLKAKLRRFRPQAVAFTSLTAGRLFLGKGAIRGRQPRDWEGMAMFVLPSPSGRARSHFALEPWQDLAAFVAARR